MKRLIFCVFILCSLLFLHSCTANRHFMELRAMYSFDAEAQALIKYPSPELMFEPNEILAYCPETSRTSPLEFRVIYVTLQKHDNIIGGFYDYDIAIAYTVHNGRLLLASIPNMLPLYEYFRFGSSTDSVIVTVGNENAYLVNLSNSSAERLFSYGDFIDYFDRDSIKDLIFAQVLSVSPDGRYVLYRSNRNYIDDATPNNFDLFYLDMQTGNEARIMNFQDKEILTWDKNNPGSFLFRELQTARDGTRNFSPILSYSLVSGTQSVFLNLNEKYRAYEMIDDEYIYILRRVTDEETGHTTNILYIANIYTHEMFSLDVGIYHAVHNVKISDTKDYIVFLGEYMTPIGWILTEIVTVHIATNDIVPQYDQRVETFNITSFYWAPNNVLIVNFRNMTDLYRDLCRFHRITHSARGVEHRVNRIYDLTG